MTAIDPYLEGMISTTAAPAAPLPSETADRSGSLSVHVADIRRRWGWVALGTAAGVLAGIAYLGTGQQVTATTDVDVSSVVALARAAGGTEAFDAGTDIELASSYPVAATAAASLGEGVGAADLRKNATITAVDGTPIVHVEYTGTSASEARARADAIARAYLRYRTEAVSALLSAQQAVAGSTDEDDIALPASRILTSAADNPVTTPTTPLAVVASGGVVGGAAGIAAALALAYAGRRRHSRSDIVRRVGPVLVDLTAAADDETIDDGMRVARERLLLQSAAPLVTIAVLDLCASNEGRSVPHDLAGAFREMGWECLVARPGDEPELTDAFEFEPLHIVAVGPRPLLSQSLHAARTADGVVLVLDPARERVDEAAALASEIRSAGATVLGTVLVASRRATPRSFSPSSAIRKGNDHD
jgi:hypothetical protein